MTNSKVTLALIGLLVASVSFPALARGNGRFGGHSSAGARVHSGHSGAPRGFLRGPRIGFFVGAPVFAAPFFYPPARFYYPPLPPTYIQQPYVEQPYIQQPSPPYWYFCPEANGYYPQIRECPGGWQQVLPEPSAPAPSYPAD